MPRNLLTLCALLLALPAYAADITVSAAASLTNAFRELAPLFESQRPGTRVRLNFGASGALMQQIDKGAPADVFASADQKTMDMAQDKGLVRVEQRIDFAANALVLIVPVTVTALPKALADLQATTYRRIAIGSPASVPAGRYARGALQEAGLWRAIEPKTIGTQNVRQALDYVARAEVDAGFVYATDAALMPDKVQVAFTVPTDPPILYPIAALAASAHPELARAFVAFVQSPAARAVLANYGFSQP